MRNMDKTIWYRSFLLIVMAAIGMTGCGDRDKTAYEESLHLGTKAMEERDWNRAITQFTQGLEISPDDDGLLYHRAAAYLAKARDSYNLASAAATRNDMAVAEAEAKSADANFENAKRDCLKLIELNARNADAWYVKGCIELYLGDWNGAIESFSASIREKGDNPCAWQRRGEVYAHIGDNANSIVDLKKAAELGYVDSRKNKGTNR